MTQDKKSLDTAEQPVDENMELEFEDEALAGVAISDTDLESDDQQKAAAAKKAKKHAKELLTPEEKHRLKKKKILIIAAGVLAVILLLFTVPVTRWPILNFFGLRSTLIVTVTEESTEQPISNAVVRLGEQYYGVTDPFGRARFDGLPFGRHSATIEKPGYSRLEVTVTNGLGTTKLPPQHIKAIGLKVDVDVKDWLSELPIPAAKLRAGEFTAESDKAGHASLIIAPTEEEKIEIEVAAPGYITKTETIELNVAAREISLVPAPRNYFFTNRDGRLDLFASNLDGAKQQKVIEGTGKEDKNLLQFTVHRANQQAIMVATRDGRQQGGRIVAGVYAVDLEKATLKKIDEGTDVRLLDWGGESIAYVKADPGLNYDDPAYSRIMTYNIATGRLAQVAQANYFPVAIVAQNKVYYSPADAYRTIENAALTSFDLGNSARRTYLDDKQITSAVRPNYGALNLMSIDGAYFDLQLGNGATRGVDRQNPADFSFAPNPSNNAVVWADQRDGQGALLTRPTGAGNDRVVVAMGGLSGPVRFVSDAIAVVRIRTSQEHADYVVHIATGKIRKIVDVAPIGY